MAVCTNCGEALQSFVCENCSTLNSRDENSDYFHLFFNHLKTDFSLDELEAVYYRRQKEVHPDHFQHKSEDQRRLADVYSSRFNEGFKTLKDPIRRLRYISELFDLFEKSDQIPTEVLADIFEIQELLHEPKLNDDQVRELENFRDNFEDIMLNLKSKATKIFIEFVSMDEEVKKKVISEILNKTSYIKRIVDQIDEKLETI